MPHQWRLVWRDQAELVEELTRYALRPMECKRTPLPAPATPAEERVRHDATLKQERAARAAVTEIRRPVRDAAELSRYVRQQENVDALARLRAEQAVRWAARPAPRPGPQPYGVSHEGAELLVRDWMRHLGILDAEVTRERQSADGGIDVTSATHVAQVKNYQPRRTVSVTDVRELFGVAAAAGKTPLFFTSGQ